MFPGVEVSVDIHCSRENALLSSYSSAEILNRIVGKNITTPFDIMHYFFFQCSVYKYCFLV